MERIINDYVVPVVFFVGVMIPLFWWVWIGLCKYVLHFRKECNNRNCLYRCRKCPRLRSEMLQMRIARLEEREIKNTDYIMLLKEQLEMYLQNPDLDRETDSQMISRLAKMAKENQQAFLDKSTWK